MDLAIEFGNPHLGQVLRESEFQQWARYAKTYGLPTRRLEIYLANVALLIAKTMGGDRQSTLRDFLFDPPEVDPVKQLQAAKEAFGFNPRKKRSAA